MIQRSDRRYRFTDFDLMSTYAKMAFVNTDVATSKLNLQTISEYEKAISIHHYARNVYLDLAYLSANKYEANLTHPTFLKSNITQYMRDVASLTKVLERKGNLEARDKLIESSGYLQRIASNVLSKDLPLTNFTPKSFSSNYEVWELQKEISNFQIDALFALESSDVSDILLQRELMEKLVQSGLIVAMKGGPVKVPLYFRALFLLRNIMPALTKLSKIVADVVTKASSILSYAASSITNWGDIKNNPFGAIMNVMASLNYTVTYGLGFWYTVIKASTSVIHLIEVGYNKYKDDYASGKDVSKTKLIIDVLKGIGNILIDGFRGITNIIVSGFQGAFATYNNLSTSLLKLLKNIIETSPFMSGILEIFGTIFNMFFAPFFIAFGKPILDLLSKMIYTTSFYGLLYSNTLTKDTEEMAKFNESLGKILFEVKRLALIFIEVFVPRMLSLTKPIIDFILSFVEVLINNSKLIEDLFAAGTDAFNEMLDAGVLSEFLKFGTTFFIFLEENAEGMLSIFKGILSFIKWSLKVYIVTIRHIREIMYLILALSSALAGAYIGAKAGSFLTIFTAGISIVVGAVSGAIVGASAGILLAKKIDEDYLQPIELDESIIPEFYKGGKIEYTPGGKVGIFAERGEGEYIIPESKTSLFKKAPQVFINFNGKVYNYNALKREVRHMGIGKVTDVF